MANDLSLEAFNRALAASHPRPPLPPGLHARVMADAAREPAVDWERKRSELVRQHRASIAQLNRLYLHRFRDFLLVCCGLIAMAGSMIGPVAQWLMPWFAGAAPGAAGALALGAGLFFVAIAARDVLGGSPAQATADTAG